MFQDPDLDPEPVQDPGYQVPDPDGDIISELSETRADTGVFKGKCG